mmetsp:Transcript_2586/g.6962  ORF Transcript_2586/g.6962 Transcript_2586/m.6962 type:complete len:324 (+) Transcript_2586:205-1176(+)
MVDKGQLAVGFPHLAGRRAVGQLQGLVVQLPRRLRERRRPLLRPRLDVAVGVEVGVDLLICPVLQIWKVLAREAGVLHRNSAHSLAGARRDVAAKVLVVVVVPRPRLAPLARARAAAVCPGRLRPPRDLGLGLGLGLWQGLERLEEREHLVSALALSIEVPKVARVPQLRLGEQLPAQHLPEPRAQRPAQGGVLLAWQRYAAALALGHEVLLLHAVPAEVLLELQQQLLLVRAGLHREAALGALALEVFGGEGLPPLHFHEALQHLLLGRAAEDAAPVRLRAQVVQRPALPALLLGQRLLRRALRLRRLGVGHREQGAAVEVL